MKYSKDIASHYRAYRPPLHQVILSKTFTGQFQHALDVGCGTGASSVALAKYSDHVLALDPSEEMLAASVAHPRIEYVEGVLPMPELSGRSYDLIAFAGSINYCYTNEVFEEVLRLLKPNGYVVVYDFNVLLASILKIDLPKTTYDHTLNWDAFNKGELKTVKRLDELYQLQITREEFIHLCKSEEGIPEVMSDQPRVTFSVCQVPAQITGTLYIAR